MDHVIRMTLLLLTLLESAGAEVCDLAAAEIGFNYVTFKSASSFTGSVSHFKRPSFGFSNDIELRFIHSSATASSYESQPLLSAIRFTTSPPHFASRAPGMWTTRPSSPSGLPTT